MDRRALLEASLIKGALQSLGPDHIYAQIATIEARGDLVRLAPDVWTTPSIAACEAALLRAADRPHERAWITPSALEEALGQASHLSQEQREAVDEAARSDGVSIVEAARARAKRLLRGLSLTRPIGPASKYSAWRRAGSLPTNLLGRPGSICRHRPLET